MRIAGMVGLMLALNQAPDSGAPAMPYVDQGACPFECCTYRDWVAEAGFQAVDYWMADGAGKRKPSFKIVKGERVTAMTGVVLTTQPGVVRIVKPGEIEVYSKRLPRAPAEKIRLSEGDRLYLFTNQGEGYVSGWFRGRVLESFDTVGFAPAADCDKLTGGCVGIVERRPESEWWVKVRNRQGAIGWLLIPKGFSALSFDKMDGCG
jgi:hypothetical protein